MSDNGGDQHLTVVQSTLQTLQKILSQQRRHYKIELYFRTARYLLAGLLILLLAWQFLPKQDAEPFRHQNLMPFGNPVQDDGQTHLALIRLSDNDSWSQLNAVTINTGLQQAFASSETRAVILSINSSGLSAVQNNQVFNRILTLKEQYPAVEVYAVIDEAGLAGAYYIAAAADKIYANSASLIGSIGIVSSGFGFEKMIEKLGIERRIYSAGRHKAFLDQFQAENTDEVNQLQTILKRLHQQVIDGIRSQRGATLRGSDDTLFEGLFWSGQQALELGLIDGLKSLEILIEELNNLPLEDYTPRPSFNDWLSGLLENNLRF